MVQKNGFNASKGKIERNRRIVKLSITFSTNKTVCLSETYTYYSRLEKMPHNILKKLVNPIS